MENIPENIMADLQQAAARAAKGVRDPQRMRHSREEMDRIRAEILRRHGVLDIGVPAIRDLRE
jgi:hypothetical protein